jgi:glycosyltransferase involved in cell wall biosynthesis
MPDPTTYTLDAVLIARNEARCITQCLKSIAGIADRIIVLDTGSTDNTVALAQAAGAEVHHMVWPDDFSEARNAALALSKADWQLVIDADEVLTQGAQALQALKRIPPTFVGRLEILSHYQLGQSPRQSSHTWLPRVLPKGVQYEGSIHESPVFNLPRRDLPVRFDHDGYLPEQMAAKSDRNRTLLKKAVRAKPNDAYLQYQLGKDHEVHDRFEAALPCYDKALRLLSAQRTTAPRWRHDLVLRTLFALKATARLDEAVQLAETEMPNWVESPDFYFVLGDILLDFTIAHPQDHATLVPMIEAAWRQCLIIGENPNLEGAVQGRGSDLAQHNLALLERMKSAF